MKGHQRTSGAERTGAWLGRAWRQLARGERRVADWLVRGGMPVPTVRALVWAARLCVLAAMLYFFFIAAAVCVVLVAMTYVRSTSNPTNSLGQFKWRHGPEGFGLYNRGGFRIDPYDPDRASDPDGGAI